jgi:hypothetical protein
MHKTSPSAANAGSPSLVQAWQRWRAGVEVQQGKKARLVRPTGDTLLVLQSEGSEYASRKRSSLRLKGVLGRSSVIDLDDLRSSPHCLVSPVSLWLL